MAIQISTPAPGLGAVQMDRPDVFNAYDESMIGQLDAAFEQLATDDRVA